MRFKVRKTLRVPVPEPARVNEAAGRAPRSLERWIQRPENVMEVVFSEEGVIPQESGEWRISVIKLPFLEWELNPEFDLRVLPKDAAAREFGVRMVSDALRFAPEGGLEKLPPGFAGMDIWSYIDCELFIERLADDDDGGAAAGEVAHGGVRGHRPAHRGGHPRRVSMDTVLRGDRRERHRGQHREAGESLRRPTFRLRMSSGSARMRRRRRPAGRRSEKLTSRRGSRGPGSARDIL